MECDRTTDSPAETSIVIAMDGICGIRDDFGGFYFFFGFFCSLFCLVCCFVVVYLFILVF